MEPIEDFSNIRGAVPGGSIWGLPYFRKVSHLHPDSPDMPREPITIPSARMLKRTRQGLP